MLQSSTLVALPGVQILLLFLLDPWGMCWVLRKPTVCPQLSHNRLRVTSAPPKIASGKALVAFLFFQYSWGWIKTAGFLTEQNAGKGLKAAANCKE